MIRNNGNFANTQNRNFSQMLDDINFNLSNFPLTSLNNGINGVSSSNNVQRYDRQAGQNGISNQNILQASFLYENNDSSSSQSQQIGVQYQRSQLNSNASNQQDIQANNYSRNRDNHFLAVNEGFSTYNHQINNLRKKQNSSPKIQDILTCFICLGKLKNANMCPDCQKMCCEGCIKEWLSNKSQCPHCRSHLRPSKLMKCRFVSEITTALEKIEQIEQKKEKQGICQEHDNPLQYYCQICKHPVCSDCGMIGSKHKTHKFEKLNTVYDSHVKQVKKELSEVEKKLKELNKQQNDVDQVIEKLLKIRDDKTLSLSSQMEHVNIKLSDLLKSKLEKLSLQRDPIQEEIELLESMSEEINYHIETLPKSVLINKSNEMVQTLEEINNRRVIKNYISENDKKLDFYYDIIPSYDSADFFLENYSVKKRSTEIVYSETLLAHGNEWRLKVYLKGKDKAKDNYLSVFIEMTKGCIKDSNFEYRVEMINQINPDLRITREFISPFKTGDTWGYERFFKLDQLEQEGYLLPESDMLILKYYIRSPSYSQFCQSKQIKIEELELKNEQLLEEIKILQNNQNQKEGKFSESDSLNKGQEDEQSNSIDESKAENFELETFINDIEHSNISNVRSDFENYLKQRKLEEFEKSDNEEDEDENHDEDEEEEQDVYCEEDEAKSSDKEEQYRNDNNQDRNHQHDLDNDNDENIYEYKTSANNRNQNIDRFLQDQQNQVNGKLGRELKNLMYNDEFDKINAQIARIKLSDKEEVNSQDLSYLCDELKLNNKPHNIQDLLNQETDNVINAINHQNSNKQDSLQELELQCQMKENKDVINQMTSTQQNQSENLKQLQFKQNKEQIKQRNEDITESLCKNNGNLILNEEKERKDIDYRLRWNGIMQNMNKVIQGNPILNNNQNSSQTQKSNNNAQINLQQQVINNNQDYLFEENKSLDQDQYKQSILTQQNEDIYSCLDEIGDKVLFVPLNLIENYKQLNDSSLLVKKNLLPEFEQEAQQLEQKKSQYQQNQNKLSRESQNDQIQNNQQPNVRLTTKISESASTNKIALQKNTLFQLSEQQISEKNKYSNYEGQYLQNYQSNEQQSINQALESSKNLSLNNNSIFFKENGVTSPNDFKQEGFMQKMSNNASGLMNEKYNNSNKNTTTKNDIFNHKVESQNCQQNEYLNILKSEKNFLMKSEIQNISKKEEQNVLKQEEQIRVKKQDSHDKNKEGYIDMKSGRLYVQQINIKNVDEKNNNLPIEPQLQKYNLRKNDGESLGNSINDQKQQASVLQNSISSKSIQMSQLNSHRITNQINNKEENTFLGTFSNPTLSRMIASHSKKEENNEDIFAKSQNNQIKSGTIFSIQSLNNNQNTASSKRYLSQTQSEKPEIAKYEEENEDSLEKENKDDSLLALEKQIQKLENMNKQGEDQKLQVPITSQRVLQTKEIQQGTNIPSQQNYAEARKQLISSINFTEEFLKKVNKIKSYSNINQVQNQQIAKNLYENQDSNSPQISLRKDPSTEIQNNISQKNYFILKSSTSELSIAQNQYKSLQLTTNSSVPENNVKKQNSFGIINQTGDINNIQKQVNVNQSQKNNSACFDIKKQEEFIKELENIVVENHDQQ